MELWHLAADVIPPLSSRATRRAQAPLEPLHQRDGAAQSRGQMK